MVNCKKCEVFGTCCRYGCWVDLEEAKEILKLDTFGEFNMLEEDEDFPSGYKVCTSKDNQTPCTFLLQDGSCVIHKIDFNKKPKYCKEFPKEDGKIPNYNKQLCPNIKVKYFLSKDRQS